jgi:hypothetical protein
MRTTYTLPNATTLSRVQENGYAETELMTNFQQHGYPIAVHWTLGAAIIMLLQRSIETFVTTLL